MITSSHKISTYSMIMARCMDVKKIMTKKIMTKKIMTKKIMTKKRVILKFDSLFIC
jgi:hypothetical protein